IGGFEGRVSPKDDSDNGANHQANHYPIHRDNRRELEEIGGGVASKDAQHHLSTASHLADHDRLHDELGHDVAFLGPDSPADADFTGAFGNRHQHNVHYTDTRCQQGNRADRRNSDPDGHREGIELRNERIIGKDLKVIFLSGRDFAYHAQYAPHLFDGIIKAGLITCLHQYAETVPPSAKAIESGGYRYDREIVLVAVKLATFCFQHTDNRVVNSIDFQAFANR